MRFLALVLLLAGCSPEAAKPPAERLLYAGEGRDRLCITGQRAGFIVYGQGDSNCSGRGEIHRAGEQLRVLTPAGDADCRIDLVSQADTIRFGKMDKACAYYCGPGADYSGKLLTKSTSASPAVDFAGDPLC